MIFGKCEFEGNITKELYKSQMNGFNDKTLKDYNPILMSGMFKEEVREKEQKEEFIMSYLESAKIIMEETYHKQDRLGVGKIFFSYSLVLPTIYLCRHCLELAIKRAIEMVGKEAKQNHSLLKLWSALRGYLNNNEILETEKATLNEMEKFIRSIDSLDDNGMRLRYSKQKDNSDSQKEFLWANTRRIVEQTEMFVRQLQNIKLV